MKNLLQAYLTALVNDDGLAGLQLADVVSRQVERGLDDGALGG